MTWFQPPQLRIESVEETPRHATWLELFFDLVFVVAVSQLAHNLAEDVSLTGFLGFVFLFVPVWWSWIGATLYANRFDVDDVGHRLLMGVQMLAIATMAVNIHHALSDTSVGFALGYATVRAVLVFQYLRAARHVPRAKDLATRYAQGFSIAAGLWFVSVFVPMPLRLVFWGAGLFVDFATPLSAVRLQVGVPPHLEHLPERFGLFTIIVLGEAIIAVVNGVSQQEWSWMSATSAGLGFLIAFSLWWIYFENVDGSAVRAAMAAGQLWLFQVWFYGHLPLLIGLAGTGVAVEHIIHSPTGEALTTSERWLLCGCVALCLAALSILHRTGVIFRCKVRSKYRLIAALALIGLAIVGNGLAPIAVISCVAVICATQVAQDVYQGHPKSAAIEPST